MDKPSLILLETLVRHGKRLDYVTEHCIHSPDGFLTLRKLFKLINDHKIEKMHDNFSRNAHCILSDDVVRDTRHTDNKIFGNPRLASKCDRSNIKSTRTFDHVLNLIEHIVDSIVDFDQVYVDKGTISKKLIFIFDVLTELSFFDAERLAIVFLRKYFSSDVLVKLLSQSRMRNMRWSWDTGCIDTVANHLIDSGDLLYADFIFILSMMYELFDHIDDLMMNLLKYCLFANNVFQQIFQYHGILMHCLIFQRHSTDLTLPKWLCELLDANKPRIEDEMRLDEAKRKYILPAIKHLDEKCIYTLLSSLIDALHYIVLKYFDVIPVITASYNVVKTEKHFSGEAVKHLEFLSLLSKAVFVHPRVFKVFWTNMKFLKRWLNVFIPVMLDISDKTIIRYFRELLFIPFFNTCLTIPLDSNVLTVDVLNKIALNISNVLYQLNEILELVENTKKDIPGDLIVLILSVSLVGDITAATEWDVDNQEIKKSESINIEWQKRFLRFYLEDAFAVDDFQRITTLIGCELVSQGDHTCNLLALCNQQMLKIVAPLPKQDSIEILDRVKRACRLLILAHCAKELFKKDQIQSFIVSYSSGKHLFSHNELEPSLKWIMAGEKKIFLWSQFYLNITNIQHLRNIGRKYLADVLNISEIGPNIKYKFWTPLTKTIQSVVNQKNNTFATKELQIWIANSLLLISNKAWIKDDGVNFEVLYYIIVILTSILYSDDHFTANQKSFNELLRNVDVIKCKEMHTRTESCEQCCASDSCLCVARKNKQQGLVSDCSSSLIDQVNSRTKENEIGTNELVQGIGLDALACICSEDYGKDKCCACAIQSTIHSSSISCICDESSCCDEHDSTSSSSSIEKKENQYSEQCSLCGFYICICSRLSSSCCTKPIFTRVIGTSYTTNKSRNQKW